MRVDRQAIGVQQGEILRDFKHVAPRKGLALCLGMFSLLLGACQPESDASAELVEAVELQTESDAAATAPVASLAELDNAGFRDRVVAFARSVASEGEQVDCPLPDLGASTPVRAVVKIYRSGELEGHGMARHAHVCEALSQAASTAAGKAELSREGLEQARFIVEFPSQHYGVVEHEGKGLEYVSGLVPVRSFDKGMLRQRIDEGTDYLLRVMDPKLGGVHKFYYAQSDEFEQRLHSIYTASTIYTLLALYEHDKDERLLEPIDRAADFLLSMQREAPGQPGHGAFHYTLDTSTRQPEPRFVVGTTSKTIFTLIELDELNGDPKYLESARAAAEWLISMQGADGSVSPELYLSPAGEWEVPNKESMLYSGQVLSALSRLYEATQDARYLEAAALTAAHLGAKVEREGCYLGDDYRERNPISSSWTILSLFDYARASGDQSVRETAYTCADKLLERQIDNPEDVYRHGRWSASLSSSGAGWLAEVLATLYLDCPESDADHCERYKRSIVMLMRLLMQYTYSPENSFVTKVPDMARGGLFWNTLERYVRTDSVCHAMNAYVFMIDHLSDGVLLELPEAPLESKLHSKG